MSWNYRVMRGNYPHHYLAIHEVYYNESGAISGWRDEPSGPFGETIEEIQEDLDLFSKALTLPVIDCDDGKEILPEEDVEEFEKNADEVRCNPELIIERTEIHKDGTIVKSREECIRGRCK